MQEFEVGAAAGWRIGSIEADYTRERNVHFGSDVVHYMLLY